jgi:hypothetical protein
MKRLAVALLLTWSCEFVDEAARRRDESERSAVETSREERILLEFFSVDDAQRIAAHLKLGIVNFDSISQPRPRLEDIVSVHSAADEVWEEDLSGFGFRSGRWSTASVGLGWRLR